MKQLTTVDRQTFCIYCQREFDSPIALAQHIVEQHKGTYAADRVVLVVEIEDHDA